MVYKICLALVLSLLILYINIYIYIYIHCITVCFVFVNMFADDQIAHFNEDQRAQLGKLKEETAKLDGDVVTNMNLNTKKI
jgi:hypothetical protein